MELDKSVLEAYGWNDLNLEHGYHTTKQGPRFTISDRARLEVLIRLLRLNHERHETEAARVVQTPAARNGKRDRRESKPQASQAPGLFD